MIVGVLKETLDGEQRIALVPAGAAALAKAGHEVLIEAGAGQAAGYPDRGYEDQRARIAASAEEVFGRAEVICRVRALDGRGGRGSDVARYRSGQHVIGLCDALDDPATVDAAAKRGIILFALELLPRITRAQSMDVLSSMASIAGYKAVLIAAAALPRLFPMMMTAAGTITPARVFVIGAGVAGLQAIATSRRLGAVVQAYDVRPQVKDEVQSLGARFVELPLQTEQAQDAGGYAKALGEEFYRTQREVMTRVVAESDVVITTALIPGKTAPLLVPEEAIQKMSPGSIIVDLAAERGGNCALTRANETVVQHGVTIFGPTNLPSTVPYHASQMFSKNIAEFLLHVAKGGAIDAASEDEIIKGTLVAREGVLHHPRVQQALAAAGASPTSEGAA